MKKAALLDILLFLVAGLAVASLIAQRLEEGSLIQGGHGPKPRPPVDSVHDETAKFISGLPCSTTPFRELEETAEWKNYAEMVEKTWADLTAKRFQLMRDWSASELRGPHEKTKVLFYPFGGPDFMTAFVLFPNAETYILLGLEIIGELPEFDAAEPLRPSHYLANMNAALSDFFDKSYFITKNMVANLTADKVDGVLPILAFFLKRTGHVISSIKRCEFLEQGELLEADAAAPHKKRRRPYGVKIEFYAEGKSNLQTLYYFSADLENRAFGENSSLYLYLNGLGFETTFIKSASYLMHYKEFSNIRNMILEKSRYVLEDDTGIPYKYFPAADWEAILFGQYTQPVKDFSGVEQIDLKAAYANSAGIRKLPFHLGYHWGTNKDTILFFKKKNGGASR